MSDMNQELARLESKTCRPFGHIVRVEIGGFLLGARYH